MKQHDNLEVLCKELKRLNDNLEGMTDKIDGIKGLRVFVYRMR